MEIFRVLKIQVMVSGITSLILVGYYRCFVGPTATIFKVVGLNRRKLEEHNMHLY
jgi:hypothetical protein